METCYSNLTHNDGKGILSLILSIIGLNASVFVYIFIFIFFFLSNCLCNIIYSNSYLFINMEGFYN